MLNLFSLEMAIATYIDKIGQIIDKVLAKGRISRVDAEKILIPSFHTFQLSIAIL